MTLVVKLLKWSPHHRDSVLFTTLVLIECGVLPDIQNVGFYCDDPKLKFKFSGETISAKILLLVTSILPNIVITFVEWYCHGPEAYVKRGGGRWAWLTQSLQWYREFFSGLLIVFVLADVAKLVIGEPRPHFLETCQPHQAINCTSGYISEYTCTNKNVSSWRVKDASRSFPSGHAAISFYLFTFVALFLERRAIGVRRSVLTWFQISVLIWALICSLTRITDRRHHWWDVLAGSILGVIIGQYIVRKFCCNFQLVLHRNLSSDIKQIDDKEQRRPLCNDNTSTRRLVTTSLSYNSDSPIHNRSDQTLT